MQRRLNMIDPLDALLNSALAEQYQRKRTVKASPSEKPKRPILPRSFDLPENWHETRTVALIHQPSNTLLGSFREFLYDRAGIHARKLVRVDAPTGVDGSEYVTGDWWLTADAERRADPARWVETRELVLGIILAECGLSAPDALVRVRLEFGGIARVELTQETRFVCAARDTFLILPAGLDLLQAMSFDSKLALKAELEPAKENEE
jgi:hypothetical protein